MYAVYRNNQFVLYGSEMNFNDISSVFVLKYNC